MHRRLFGKGQLLPYWSADETKWATDMMFGSRKELSAVYPRLVQSAMTTFGSGEVLRFLGRRGTVQQFQSAEILSFLGTRSERIRGQHAIDSNSVKKYDKQESILRAERTINNRRHQQLDKLAHRAQIQTVSSTERGINVDRHPAFKQRWLRGASE